MKGKNNNWGWIVWRELREGWARGGVLKKKLCEWQVVWRLKYMGWKEVRMGNERLERMHNWK